MHACNPSYSLHDNLKTKKNGELVFAKRVGASTPLVSDVKTYFTSSSAGLKAVKLIIIITH